MATTKAYTTQLVLMDLVGLYLADLLGTVEQSEYDTILSEMQLLPEKMRQFLSHTEDIQYYASRGFLRSPQISQRQHCGISCPAQQLEGDHCVGGEHQQRGIGGGWRHGGQRRG